MREDALGTLREVARAGYRAVELVGYGNADVDSIGELLSDLDVSVLGAHISYEDLGADLDTAIADLVALDAEYLVVQQARPRDWSTVDSIRRLAATLNEWGAASLERGLSLGYHGYHPIEAEFALLPTGVAAYDLMVAETDPSLVTIQVDTYWVTRVGRDTAQVLASLAGRVPTLHLKDMAPPPVEGDVPVGDGVLPWPEILDAAEAAGTSWLVVEQEDDPANAFRDIRRSLAFVRGLALTSGRS